MDLELAIIVPTVVIDNGLIVKTLNLKLTSPSLDSYVTGIIQKAVLLDPARIVDCREESRRRPDLQ